MKASVLLALPLAHVFADSAGSCSTTVNQDCLSNDIQQLVNSNPDACCNACTSTANCGAFVYVSGGTLDGNCYLKTSCVPTTGCGGGGTCTAGTLSPPPSPAPSPTPTPSDSCSTTADQDCLGNDIETLYNSNSEACCDACTSMGNCGAFVYVSGGTLNGNCYLKTSCVPMSGCGGGGTCTAGTVTPSPSPSPSPSPTPPTPVPTGVSYRVAKALGSRGYNMVRVSKVDIGPFPSGLQQAAGGVAWSYSSQFVHRWTNMHLSSALVTVQPGASTTLDVDGASLQVRLPAQGAGTVGLLIADPCIIQSVWCPYQDVFDIENTLQSVLNSMAAHNELDYWMNIGDLFYDQIGNISTKFFSGLSAQVQATVHGVSMGNHDYWNDGSPGTAASTDNFGNGLMQWYAQDAMSAKANPAAPFDFSQNPDLFQVAHFSNFFWYYMLGNVAFISYSGQASWNNQYSYFTEACSWAGSQNPDLVVLLGHWDADNLGCASGMATPEAYSQILSLPGCSALSSRIKYFEGHNHCNHITKTNIGFMIGSFGMGGCGDFGLPVLDTRNGEAKLWYFNLGSGGVRHSNWDTVLGCIKANGASSCLQYADQWMLQSLSYDASNTSGVTLV